MNTNRTTYPELRVGPDRVTMFDMKDPKSFEAWEAAWGEHLGQTEVLPPLTVNGKGKISVADQAPQEMDPEKKARRDEAMAYIREYRGSWGFILDLRADPRWNTVHFRLSERQVEVVLASKAREAGWAKERAERQARIEQERREAAAPTGNRANQDGWYRLGEEIFKVQKAVHGSGNLYAKRLVRERSGEGQLVWEYAPGMIRQLTNDQRLTLEEAKDLGKLYGACVICSRTLTDEESIEAGIGPVCARRFE